jgi:hypothetical protein
MRALILALCLVAGSVSAKPIAVFKSGAGQIALDDRQDYCPDGSKKATWVGPDRSIVQGCWFKVYGRVWLFFEDGDVGAILEGQIRWADS